MTVKIRNPFRKTGGDVKSLSHSGRKEKSTNIWQMLLKITAWLCCDTASFLNHKRTFQLALFRVLVPLYIKCISDLKASHSLALMWANQSKLQAKSWLHSRQCYKQYCDINHIRDFGTIIFLSYTEHFCCKILSQWDILYMKRLYLWNSHGKTNHIINVEKIRFISLM